MNKIKKVLILAYDFPPYVSVGGLRPYSWYRYLNESGFYPIVITRQWGNKYGNNLDYISASESKNTEIEKTDFGEIIKASFSPNLSNRLLLKYGESRFKVIRKIITAYYEFGQFLFMTGPKSSLFFAANEYLKTNKVDIIIATGGPFILFKYASKLSKKYNTLWIADYRDPWTQDKSNRKNFIIQKWDAFFEKKCLAGVRSIITVSSFLQKQISSLISDKTFHIIPNGYSTAAIESTKGIKQDNKKLSIAYVGTIYKWHPLESFLRVCNEYMRNNAVAFQINFYGVNAENEIREMVHTTYQNLSTVVHIYPKIPNEQLLQKLAAENVFLLFNYYSYMGTKIYDYLALNRKIILCFSDDFEANDLKKKYYQVDEIESESKHLQADLIRETNSGVIVKDVAELSNVLSDLLIEFNANGFIACNSVNTNQFSRKDQVQKLAGIFHNFISEKEIPYQQCNRCVMDTGDSEIVFDEDGYCNHCKEYFENTSKRTYQGKESDMQLAQLVNKIKRKGRNKEYDCVIGVSGGVDSIYTAYLAKKMGLRPLAVHMDNGWNSELAVSNIEKILKKLNIDLITEVLDWEEFRDLQLAFLKASVPEAETPTDIAIPAAMHKVAAKYNIKYIFSGGNFATEGILPKSWHYNAKDVKFLKAIHKKFGTKKRKSFPTFGFEKEMYYKLVKGIRMIYPLNYVPYNKQEAMKVLEHELEWKNYGGKHHESIYTKFVQSYLLPEKFGIDYRRATFSTQICAGEITRDEALTELNKKPYDEAGVEEEKIYLCKKLCIDADELNEILNLPARSYKDYPNDKGKLEFIYNIYRKLNY
jgi:N-acetyl sugar amidotransferase